MRHLSKYLELTKPKVTLLNLFVGSTCFTLAELPSVNWLMLTFFVIVSYCIVGGCGVLNCYFDRDIDANMARTSQRAIPTGKIAPIAALIYGTLMTLAGLVATYFFFGMLTSLLVSLGIIFYILVYTIALKRTSRWNVLLGAIAGPFAALAGWTATGSSLGLIPVVVGALVFLWIPGHLWCLAIRMVKEYEFAGIPMLPAVSGLADASKFVFLFNIAAFGCSLVFLAFGAVGLIYLVIACIAGAKLIVESKRLLATKDGAQAFRLFMTTSPYLATIMIALLLDKLVLIRIL
jgi:protoheme IX farnesyltransferase